MKKFAVVLLVLSLTRIGVAYADTNNTANSQNYFFGVKSAAANLNQVLALLVGPKGDPGPAGVAGKDGLIGMNGKDGKDGKDGLNGAPGAVGQAGAAGVGVLAVAFNGIQGGCTVGGVKFTDAAGTTTYACNGRNGTDGTGGGGGNTTITNYLSVPPTGFTYAQGAILIGTCDKFVTVKPLRAFTRLDTATPTSSTGFTFSGFSIGNANTIVTDSSTVPATPLDGGIEPACDGQQLTIEFIMDSAYNGAPYTANDSIVCTTRHNLSYYSRSGFQNKTIVLSGGHYANIANSSSSVRNAAFQSGDFSCVPSSNQNASFSLAFINTADYTDSIGFSIG